jgi:threonine synthase
VTTLAVPAAFADSPARALVCRECGHESRSRRCTSVTGASRRSRWGYDLDKLKKVTRASIEAGPQTIWRYAGLLPAGQDVATRVDLGRRLCRRCARRTTSPRPLA